jgi:hypothetical protein
MEVFMLVSIIFLLASASIMFYGMLVKKDGKFSSVIDKISIICTICVLISTISMIVTMGPSRSSDGTEMTAALNKLTGGWSDTIMLGVLYFVASGFVSMGVGAGLAVILKKINDVMPNKKLLLPRIVPVLLSGILEIMLIIYIIAEIPELIKIFRYASKPDGIHHVQFSGLFNMTLKSTGGINYSVGLGYVWLPFLIALALCICFIVSLISLIKAIRINKNL